MNADKVASNRASPPGALDDGALCVKPRVRDRIFETACDLFYKRGIRDVGVDTIALEAGTNKMSFYRSFGSKDQLVAEYLEQKCAELWAWWDRIEAEQPGNARGQIEALFDAFVAKSRVEDWQGCALANALVELAEADHPGRVIAVAQKLELRRRFRVLAAAAGVEKADELGDALMLVMEGGCLTRRSFGAGGGPVQTAGLAVRVLLDAYAVSTAGACSRARTPS